MSLKRKNNLNKLNNHTSDLRPADQLLDSHFMRISHRLKLVSNIKIKTWQALIVIIFIAGFATAVFWTAYQDEWVPSWGQEVDPNIRLVLQPQSGTHQVGESFEINLRLYASGEEIDGADIHYLKFPSNLLEITDIEIGELLTSVAINQINNESGTLNLSLLASGGETYSGNGILATITFYVKSVGTADIEFDFEANNTTDTNVASFGVDVLSSATGGSYSLTSPGNGDTPRSFNISYYQQGKGTDKNAAAVTIKIYNPGTDTLVEEIHGNGNAQGRSENLSASRRLADGFYDILIKIPHCLNIKLTNVAWPPTEDIVFGEAKAGNLQDEDNVVNSLDWSIMSNNWGTDDTVSDINTDGIVNTLDWSLMNDNWSGVEYN